MFCGDQGVSGRGLWFVAVCCVYQSSHSETTDFTTEADLMEVSTLVEAATTTKQVALGKRCDALLEKRCPDGLCISLRSACSSLVLPGGINCQDRLCPDGTCVSFIHKCVGDCTGTFEKACPDGSCIFQFDNCPGECASWDRKCSDGSCVDHFAACPGECEPGKFRCPLNTQYSGTCVYQLSGCEDYGNDHNGGTSGGGISSYWIYFLILVPIVVLIACCKYYVKNQSHAQRRPRHRVELSHNTNMQPVISGVQGHFPPYQVPAMPSSAAFLPPSGHPSAMPPPRYGDHTAYAVPAVSDHMDGSIPSAPPPAYEEVTKGAYPPVMHDFSQPVPPDSTHTVHQGNEETYI